MSKMSQSDQVQPKARDKEGDDSSRRPQCVYKRVRARDTRTYGSGRRCWREGQELVLHIQKYGTGVYDPYADNYGRPGKGLLYSFDADKDLTSLFEEVR